MIYYGVIKDANGNLNASLYYGTEQFFKDTFSPDSEYFLMPLGGISGDTYAERKACARALAVDFSNNQASGLSWSEYAIVTNFFETIGKRYGLLKEFRENAIC